MIRQLWSYDTPYDKYNELEYDIDDLSCLKNFIGSPPPPYTTEDLRRNEEQKEKQKEKKDEKNRKISYNDVGQEICVTISKKPNEELGLTILSGDSFQPSWPTILDIQVNSPASRLDNPVLIGDQIKEIDGIPTETLQHSQVLSLFAKATDQVTMKIRRGVQPSERSFKWYKHPFSTVSRQFDEISVKESKSDVQCDCDFFHQENERLPKFSSFKTDDSHECKKTEYSKPMFGIRHVRSFSASAVSRRNFTQTPRQRRRTVDETKRLEHFRNFGLVLPPSKDRNVKYIADEVERLSLDGNSVGRYDSRNSLNSSLSSSTVSSFSSVSTSNTNEEGLGLMQPSWMENLVNSTQDQNTISSSGSDDVLNHSINSLDKARTPINIIRNSFRRRKAQKEAQNNTSMTSSENSESTDISSESNDHTLLLTVWIADRRRLGLRFSGGSINPYGDSNIFIQEVKKTGTANKLFRAGDEILEIDGISMNGLDVREVHHIIGKLEGNYVEFKVFRPKH